MIYDDPAYVSENPAVLAGLSFGGVVWAFTHTVTGNWHPVTMLSHMLDCSLFGTNPAGHHVTNLLLHTMNAVLLFLLLQRSTGAVWRSALVAALFGLHPLHVESVAWVAERKDVLSGFFFFLTLLAYLAYVRAREKGGARTLVRSDAHSPSAPANREKSAIRILLWTKVRAPIERDREAGAFYFVALVCFALGLMSKPMLVTLPFVLLLLDYWPLGRWHGEGVGRFSFITTGLQPEGTLQQMKGAVATASPKGRETVRAVPKHKPGEPTGLRRGVSGSSETNGGRAHLSRLLLEKAPFFSLTLAFCVITILTQQQGGAVLSVEDFPMQVRLENAVVACLAYLGKMIWPSKLAVFYPLPSGGWPGWEVGVGIAILACSTFWAISLARSGELPFVTVGWFWFVGMLVPVLGIVQVGIQAFADRYTYLPLVGCFIIIVWGGMVLASRFRLPRGGICAAATIGLAALAARTYAETGYWRNSEALLIRCIAVTHDNFVAHNNLAAAYIKEEKYQEARVHCLAALGIYPEFGLAAQNMAIVLGMTGDYQAAKSYLRHAVRIDPATAGQYSKLADVLSGQGKVRPALDFYHEYLRLKPNDARVCNNLAWMLATASDAALRDAGQAVTLAERACKLTQYKEAIFVGTLAAAYAEAKRFEDAVNAAERAIALAEAAGQDALAKRNRQLLELYRSGKAFHQES
ncbi:MAG TPA: hypothetical protein VG167_10830 [Verrucomicrobiae bacterium]|nr:hypothetical protein [Verrucomicrobiae bacterium]